MRRRIGMLGRHLRRVARRSLDRRPGPPPADDGRPVAVVIFGSHAADWHRALGPDAPVWQRVPGVVDVTEIADGGALPPPRPDRRTVVLPLMEWHILSLPRDRHEGLLPNEEAVRILGDKGSFADYVARHGLAAHAPRRFLSLADAEAPAIIKRCNLNGGHGVALAETREALASLRYSEPWRGHSVVLQAFEPSPHQYVTHMLCRQGRIVAEISYRQTLTDDPSIRRWSSEFRCDRFPLPAAIRDVIEDFLRPLRYDGPCNIDYILRGDGSVCVFEINPRFGGSLMLPENVDDLAVILSATLAWSRPLSMA